MAAKRALPVILDRRHTAGALNLPLDGRNITHTGPKGVTVGCTLVPWPEVEYVAKALGQ